MSKSSRAPRAWGEELLHVVVLQEQVEARLRELAQASESELKTALTSVPGVQVFTIEIPDHTFVVVDQESLLEEDIQEVEHLCENTGALFDG